jgi:hypothetical protein
MGGSVVVVLAREWEGEHLAQFLKVVVLAELVTLVLRGMQYSDGLGSFTELRERSRSQSR